MSRKSKYVQVPKPYEIPCCAIRVEIGDVDTIKITDEYKKNPTDENFENMLDEKEKERLLVPNRVAKKYNYVGVTPSLPYLFVLFHKEDEENAVKYFQEITSLGYKAVAIRNTIFADSRYLDGNFKGKVVSLPPEYIDKAIRDLFNKYGDNLKVNDDPLNDSLEYEVDLGGRFAKAFIGAGDKMLVLGLDHGTAHTTTNPTAHYKYMIAEFEQEILEWRRDHQGCCKKL